MKKIHESNIESSRVMGSIGHVDIMDAVSEPITAGVRIVSAHSEVPSRPHFHSEAQLIYVISGTAKITNGVETLIMEPGDFVLFEPQEEHYVITGARDIQVFEVKFTK
jgi:quercetin dioxygenase-like cupin family protein